MQAFFIHPSYLVQVGKALFDGQLLDVHFTRSFCKHILGVKVTYHDIEAIDPDYFKNLKWMLEACAVLHFISPFFLHSTHQCDGYYNFLCFCCTCRTISAMFWISLLALMLMKRSSYYMNGQK